MFALNGTGGRGETWMMPAPGKRYQGKGEVDHESRRIILVGQFRATEGGKERSVSFALHVPKRGEREKRGPFPPTLGSMKERRKCLAFEHRSAPPAESRFLSLSWVVKLGKEGSALERLI